MLKSFFLAIVAMSLVQTAYADMVFSVDRTGGPAIINIPAGGKSVFDIFVHKDAGDSRNLTMSGFDFNVNAGIGNGTQGTFTTGSLIVLGSRTIDFTTPGQAFATSASDATNPAIAIGTADVQLGSIELSTAGLSVGSKFNITLDSLNFNDSVLGSINSTGVGVSFQITAVPEPTTLMLLCGTSVCALLIRRFRTLQKIRE